MRKLLAAMTMMVMPVAALAQSPGPVLFRDIRYGETQDSVRARHEMKKVPLFGGWYMTETVDISTTCKGGIRLVLGGPKHMQVVHTVNVAGNCPEDALLSMKGKYGDPIDVQSVDYHRSAIVERRIDALLQVKNATKTTYVWVHDGLRVTLITDVPQETGIGEHQFTVIYQPDSATHTDL